MPKGNRAHDYFCASGDGTFLITADCINYAMLKMGVPGKELETKYIRLTAAQCRELSARLLSLAVGME